MPWGVIDDQAVAEARTLIGVELKRDRWQWVQTATKDAIKHFVWGIGDNNPLWLDEQYAKGTRWGGITAPSCFLYAVDQTNTGVKLPGVQWIYAGTDWEFYDVINLNDSFKVSAKLIDVVEKTGGFANRWILQISEILYFNQKGRLVAKANGKVSRLPRGEQLNKEGKRKYALREPYKYTPEEIQKIESAILAEERRGATPRFWEDVEIGDPLKPVVKGPLTSTDIIGWYSGVCGAQAYGGTHEMIFEYRRRHADYLVDGRMGIKDSAGRGHIDAKIGHEEIGMGGAYDAGSQRISWLGHLLANWMGNDGFIFKLNASLRLPNLIGDTTWCKGKVTGKYSTGDACFVDCEVWGENQMGQITMPGKAVVALPSRVHGPVQLPLSSWAQSNTGGNKK